MRTIMDDQLEKVDQEQNNCECKNCDDIDCKCFQIMDNLSETMDLAEQIGHSELYNIMLTIQMILKHIDTNNNDLSKLNNMCYEIYKELNPKEMGTLNS